MPDRKHKGHFAFFKRPASTPAALASVSAEGSDAGWAPRREPLEAALQYQEGLVESVPEAALGAPAARDRLAVAAC